MNDFGGIDLLPIVDAFVYHHFGVACARDLFSATYQTESGSVVFDWRINSLRMVWVSRVRTTAGWDMRWDGEILENREWLGWIMSVPVFCHCD